jgi:hypothetical protein
MGKVFGGNVGVGIGIGKHPVYSVGLSSNDAHSMLERTDHRSLFKEHYHATA